MENSFGFAQSIAYMMKELPEAKLSKQDLFDAYTIAGKRFGPEIGHYFVLMDWETAESMSAAIKATNKVLHRHRADILVLYSIISADPIGENGSDAFNGLLPFFCQELLGSVGSAVPGRGAALLNPRLL